MPPMNPTTVYVVLWPAENIVKVGRTVLPSRVRKFEIRGAKVLRLIHDVHERDESALLAALRDHGRRAFDSWQDSVPYLGAGGTGFSECYRVGDRLADFVAAVNNAYPEGA